MRLTSKGRYAVAAMLDLCVHGQQGPVPLASIAERQHLSLSYLEQLFRRLRAAGLTYAMRGPGGGYRLARPAEEIAIAEIIRAVDEPLEITACGNRPEGCRPDGRCNAHLLWSALGELIEGFLASVSLADVAAGRVPLPEGIKVRDEVLS